MSHRAVWIVFGDVEKFLFGFFVPERMQESYAASERLLNGVGTRDRKVNGSELRFSKVFVVMVIFVVVVVSHSKKIQGEAKKHKACDVFH